MVTQVETEWNANRKNTIFFEYMVVEKNKSEKFSVCRTVPNGAEEGCPRHLSLCPRDVPKLFLALGVAVRKMCEVF